MIKKILLPLVGCLVLLAHIGCTQSKPAESPPGYDFAKPVVFKMPEVLDEISGIAFKNGNADTVYAEQDEEGKVFYFHPGSGELSHTKFAKRGDFEDVAICNGYVIMLRSDGVLFTFSENEKYNKEAAAVNEQADLLPEGEYEAIYADDKKQQLFVLCKNCSGDKKSGVVSGYILQLDASGKLASGGNFSVDEKAIAALAGENNFVLKASALAKNPFTNQWYILSSVNKILLVTDANWKPAKIYHLKPVLFTQPEGMAFDKSGNLYISNEMGDGTNGTILQFLINSKK